MDYLNLFSLHNLALLSDWLAETGELYVDVYMPHSGGGGTGYFIRSMQDLKSLVLEQTWKEISFTIFRELQLPLRGIASESLLEQALLQFPDLRWFLIVDLDRYPRPLGIYGSSEGHEELRTELVEDFGEMVGIGEDPMVKKELNPDKVFNVYVSYFNNFETRKNQDFYEPFSRHPERYEWLIKLWKE